MHRAYSEYDSMFLTYITVVLSPVDEKKRIQI